MFIFVVHNRTLPFERRSKTKSLLILNEQVRSVNWLQTNGVIYLLVVVKGATRVGGNVRPGLPANTTHSPNAGTILCQRRRRWPNNVPALGEPSLVCY